MVYTYKQRAQQQEAPGKPPFPFANIISVSLSEMMVHSCGQPASTTNASDHYGV